MSERGRLPRRFIEDRMEYPYPKVRVVEDRRGYSGVRVGEDRRGHPDIRVVEDRRGHPDLRLVEDRRGHPDVRMVEDRRGHPDIRMAEDRRGHPDIHVVDDRRGYPGIRVVDDRRGYPGIHDSPPMRGAPRLHPAVLEEEFELQEVELRRLMTDNRALAEERAALHRELESGKDEVRHLNLIIADINAEKEAYISKLVDKRRKLEAELRANEPLRDEIVQLRGEIEKLVAVRKELSAEAASLMQELAREKSGKQQLPILEEEVHGLRQELTHVRNACALEQKGNFELVEQRKAMEKNMISMSQEIEQMRAELAKFEGRPWGTERGDDCLAYQINVESGLLLVTYCGTYGMQMGSPEVAFATQYGDSYNIHAGVSEKGPLHPADSSSWGAYDKTRLQYR
ncbi:hypothetical protein ACP70R_019934 [Stipagrostis hirtigluma subsp. patula]